MMGINLKYIAWVSTLFLTSGLLAGCSNEDLVSGFYAGQLQIVSADNQTQEYQIRSEITVGSGAIFKKSFDIALDEAVSGNLLFLIKVEASKKSIELTSDLLANGNTILLRVQGNCALSDSQYSSSYQICLSGSNVQLQAEEVNSSGEIQKRVFLYLSQRQNDDGNQNSDGNQHSDDTEYNLHEVLDLVRETNFDARVKAERVYQARQEILLARGNALPHISGGTAIKAAIANQMAMMGVRTGLLNLVSDLVPFIFPNRWYRVDVQDAFYWAERYSYQNLIANQMQMTESIFFTILRDQKILNEMNHYLPLLEDIKGRLDEMVENGNQNARISLQFKKRILNLKENILVVENLIIQENIALAKQLGIMPSSDQSFHLGEEGSFYEFTVKKYHSETKGRPFFLTNH